MKVKVIARSAKREINGADPKLARRNLDPKHHPFAAAREYQRAVVAAKLDRMMAKPFVCALEGHSDALTALAVPRRGVLVQCVTGGADGEIRAWDLASRQCVWSSGAAHVGAVKGLTLTREGSDVLSCGERSIKRWRLEVAQSTGQRTQIALGEAKPPLETWTSSSAINDVDASWARKTNGAFCTAGADGLVELWDAARSQPVRKWTWGSDSVFKARWNPAEPSLLVSTSRDRAATLFDSRAPTPLRKVILSSPCRAVAWNPREPTCFVVGGEDHACYTFDCRKLQRPRMVHEGHVSAVVDVAFAPTGKEFAAASTDRTVRLFPSRGSDAGRSRDVYHTSRMQALSGVRYTADATFVLTASEDFNLRVWKARASSRLGPVSRREAQAVDYRAKLIERHAHMPQVKRIVRSRNLPKMVKKMRDRRDEERQRGREKVQKRVDHSRAGTVHRNDARGSVVVREQA